ncbi:hypothetical protein [Edwardsiella tarda]|uniref:hypothetical protein n=1 Tax=Edwardsiella tarda TaxID=636 RepID=UPI003F65F0CB
MSDTTNPLINPERAAHEIVIELIRAGKIHKMADAPMAFTTMLNHYRSELVRIQNENKAQ